MSVALLGHLKCMTASRSVVSCLMPVLCKVAEWIEVLSGMETLGGLRTLYYVLLDSRT